MKNNYINVVYDQESHPPSTYPQELADYLISRFDIKVGSKILDAGSGNKDFYYAFKEAQMDVSGVDLYNNGDLEIFEADFERDRLPFEDNTFNICFSKSILEHLNDPVNYLNELYRVLVPGGKLILMVPDWISCIYLYYFDHSHKQPYTKESVDDLLRIIGFNDVYTQIFYQLPVVWKYPVLMYICKFLQLFGSPKKIVKNKFLRWSRELMILSSGTKE